MQGVPDPIWNPANAHIPLTSYELPHATRVDPPTARKWFFSQERELWHLVIYNINTLQIINVRDYTLADMLEEYSDHFFTGYHDDLNESDLDLNEYPVGIRINVVGGPPLEVRAPDHNVYPWREVVVYLWKILRSEMKYFYGITISNSAARDFEITFSQVGQIYCIDYAG